MTIRFWQEGHGYDRNLTQPNTILSAIDYVHEIPVRCKVCERAADGHWSSARSYLSGEQADPDLPVIDRLPADLLDEGTIENFGTAGQAGQWHPFLSLLAVPPVRSRGVIGESSIL